MVDIPELVFFANYFSLRAVRQEIDRVTHHSLWQQEVGLSYCPVDDSTLCHLISLDVPRRFFESCIEVELIRVDGMVRPHFHCNHDAVAICIGASYPGQGGRGVTFIPPPLPHVWDPWGRDGKGCWESAMPNQVLAIPRNSVHGFSVQASAKDIEPCSPFYLLTLTNGPFSSEDVTYVDVEG